MDTTHNWSLRAMEADELEKLYEKRIAPDFPSAERPSLPAMRRHVAENLQKIWIMTDGHTDAAYVVCAEANDILLVTLLAVFSENRGGGRGSALLSLLKAQYKDKRAIVLEVEDPLDAESDEDHQIRTKRISFYERNGYQFIGGVHHVSFGVHLLVMATPLLDTPAHIGETIVDDLRAIYHKILPEALWPRVTTIAT